ncbi:MAG: MMPL family transporter [Pseudonocardiaceae bacterium]
MTRLAQACCRYRWQVIAGWLVALVLLAGLASAVGADYRADLDLQGSDSAQARALLEGNFPAAAGDSSQIVFHTSAGQVTDTEVRNGVVALLDRVAALPHVTGVLNPYDNGGRQISEDGETAFATVQFDAEAVDLPQATVEDVIKTAQSVQSSTLQVELGGQAIQQVEDPPQGREAIGLIAAVVVLLLTFGSVVAMGLPIITALFGLGVGLSLVTLLTQVMNVVDVAPVLAAMISLGVGIDYALFIVSRFRTALAERPNDGDPKKDDRAAVDGAVVAAMNSSGRAVLFAGITVVIALLGLLVLGVSFIQGMAIASSLAVLLTMLASLTLLPAVLSLVGRRINKLRLPGRHPERDATLSSRWSQWAQFVQRRPWPIMLISAGLLVALVIPALSLRLGASDAGNNPTNTTNRQAYDLLAAGFGPGFNGPLVLVAPLPQPGDTTVVDGLSDAIRADPEVAQVSPPRLNPAGDTAVIQVVPRSSPQDEATTDLVHRLRDDIIPSRVGDGSTTVHIGGVTATFIDLGTTLTDRLPWFIGGVVVLSLLLLMVVFRSIVVPLKAALMNLLSIGAAFGVLVAVFQWGWGADLLGVARDGPIESFVPVIMFAILFGLSMDYEVFLLSRVHEEWLRSRDNAASVRIGLSATGGVITAAAAVMIVVFGSFVFGGQRVTQEFGIGLAVAVLLDAVVIRSALVPAVMQLLGRANWYLPGWLHWLPRLHVEATDPDPVRVAEPGPTGPDAEPSLVPVGRLPDSPPQLLIFGQVTNSGGSPVAGATLTLTDLAGRQLVRKRADSGGHYRLDPPTGGSYLVVCASAAHQPTAALVAVAQVPVRNNVVLSGTGASLSGTVCLAESGQALADAVVTLVDSHGDVVGAAVTDPSGRFSLIELTQGHCTLTVAAASLHPVTREVEIPAEGNVTVELEVATRVQLTGVVRTATAGAPVPEALATLIAADGQVVGSVTTDAEGGFRFEDLAAGAYTLIATGYPPVAAKVNVGIGTPTETVITLQPPTVKYPLTTMSGNGAVSVNTGLNDHQNGDHPSPTGRHAKRISQSTEPLPSIMPP